MKNLLNFKFLFLLLITFSLFSGCGSCGTDCDKLDINAYLEAADTNVIYPSAAQIAMLKKVIPKSSFVPAPPLCNRLHWDEVAASTSGKNFLVGALAELEKAPEIPITDELYRRANREGNRAIYKPRYYRTMDRLEKYIIGECIENEGRFIPQIETYIDSIMAMKSWLHPNHDDNENTVLEGKRVTIDLGARKFGLVLAMADALLEDKLPSTMRDEISNQLQWRLTDSYLLSCKAMDFKSNTWIVSTSNWNSVCTSGTIFSTIVGSKDYDKRVAAVGCALNSMEYYLSGFGDDGYCSEGTGYWNYGFGHYLYLAEIIEDYTDGKVDLFAYNVPEKLKRVASFPETFQIHEGMYAPFADGVTRVKEGSDNFAYIMAAKHYGAKKPKAFIPDESVQTLVAWKDGDDYTAPEATEVTPLPDYTYFDDFGIVISRGKQPIPFSIAIKAGHNAENHNHSDVGTYVLVYGDDYPAGDIGAPSYTAGAFSKTNPARSSWGHSVPRINNHLQSNGLEFRGEILTTNFTKGVDRVTMDIMPAYEVDGLEKLERTMENNKAGKGMISITDYFEASEALEFGTAISTFSDIKMLDSKSFILTSQNTQVKVKVEIESQGGAVEIVTEAVPVEHLRSGHDAKRIGLNFVDHVKRGSITVRYTPYE